MATGSPSSRATTASACRPEHRHRLTEPYVTTRAKGTGLGLAIVRKIMEDHGGELHAGGCGEWRQAPRCTLTFPLRAKARSSRKCA